MTEPAIVERVEILERKVELLESLPTRLTAVELQFVQHRSEMRDEFSAVRGEMQAMGAGLRDEMQAMGTALRSEMQAMGTALRGEMQAMGTALRDELRGEMHATADELRGEMHALYRLTIERIEGSETETRRYMRVLFEEVLSRLSTIAERPGRGKKR